MADYCVYIHENKTNGMRYVGITSQKPETRWLSGYGYYKQPHFWRAIQKYGWDGFAHIIVAEGLTAEEAGLIEAELIEKYQTRDNTKGYNKSTGGEAGAKGVVKNANQRAAASRALKAKWKDPAFREAAKKRTVEITQTDEVKRKRAESQRGRKLSEESRRKISEKKKGVSLPPFSEEHIRRMKENHAGGAEKKPVRCVETGKVYDCINDAARDTGIYKQGISNCCRKVKHYNTAGGLHWEFVEG